MSCGHLPPAGDRGQRYEVRYTGQDGRERVMGWCNAADGGGLLRSAQRWPEAKSSRVVDRQAPGYQPLPPATAPQAAKR